MRRHYDYVIIGAGPAGLAASVRAASHGLSVALLDEQGSPGGQIYRGIGTAAPSRSTILGRDYTHGQPLIERFHKAPVDYFPNTSVWHVTSDREVYCIHAGTASSLTAKRLLIATGAMERPVPIPGWTLPGVMTAGAVDVLFKSTGMVPKGRVVVAGTGPLLYLVTCHLLKCGVHVVALLDTKSISDHIRSGRLVLTALPGYKYLWKGVAMRLRLLTSRIRRFQSISRLKALGRDRLEQVLFTSNHEQHSIDADLLILHDGVVPNTQMTRLLDIEHSWDVKQRYWRPEIDVWGNSSLPDIAVAGDTGGIYGARSAEICGDLASLETVCRSGAITVKERDSIAAPWWGKLKRERAIRPFLNDLFTPSADFFLPQDNDTIVCRCEEIATGQIRQTASQSGISPNAVKAKLRCGMGSCQGRLCGLTAAEIIADAHHKSPSAVGYYRVRPPLKPIPLSALANMEIHERSN